MDELPGDRRLPEAQWTLARRHGPVEQLDETLPIQRRLVGNGYAGKFEYRGVDIHRTHRKLDHAWRTNPCWPFDQPGNAYSAYVQRSFLPSPAAGRSRGDGAVITA